MSKHAIESYGFSNQDCFIVNKNGKSLRTSKSSSSSLSLGIATFDPKTFNINNLFNVSLSAPVLTSFIIECASTMHLLDSHGNVLTPYRLSLASDRKAVELLDSSNASSSRWVIIPSTVKGSTKQYYYIGVRLSDSHSYFLAAGGDGLYIQAGVTNEDCYWEIKPLSIKFNLLNQLFESKAWRTHQHGGTIVVAKGCYLEETVASSGGYSRLARASMIDKAYEFSKLGKLQYKFDSFDCDDYAWVMKDALNRYVFEHGLTEKPPFFGVAVGTFVNTNTEIQTHAWNIYLGLGYHLCLYDPYEPRYGILKGTTVTLTGVFF